MFDCPVPPCYAVRLRDLAVVPPLLRQARPPVSDFTRLSPLSGITTLMLSSLLSLSCLTSLALADPCDRGTCVKAVLVQCSSETSTLANPALRRAQWYRCLPRVQRPCAATGEVLTFVYTSHDLRPALHVVDALLRRLATRQPSTLTAYGAAPLACLCSPTQSLQCIGGSLVLVTFTHSIGIILCLNGALILCLVDALLSCSMMRRSCATTACGAVAHS